MLSNKIYEELKGKLLHLNKYAWEGKHNWTDITDWLNNFNNIDEHIQMIYLLSQFMYFGEREIKELIKSIFRDKFRYKIIEKIRKNNNDTTDVELINNLFKEELKATRFLGVGNPSESGTHLLYFFRQENQLSKELFININDVKKDNSVRQYVFIDDFCGSGDQACDYTKNIINQIRTENNNVIVSYYVMFAMSEGINKVKDNSKFDIVDCVFELDNSFKCFSEKSRHYINCVEPIDKLFAKNVAFKYGQILCNSAPLGYQNCQLLIGFNYNTPDNTLPIIWYDENTGINWQPIFKRYNKIYGLE